MPKRKYTYGLRECVSLAVCQNAFDASLEGLSRLIAGKIPKRQAEELVVEASTDFAAFYAQRAITPVQSQSTVLAMSQDGKGIVQGRVVHVQAVTLAARHLPDDAHVRHTEQSASP